MKKDKRIKLLIDDAKNFMEDGSSLTVKKLSLITNFTDWKTIKLALDYLVNTGYSVQDKTGQTYLYYKKNRKKIKKAVKEAKVVTNYNLTLTKKWEQ